MSPRKPSPDSWNALIRRIVACRRCPRLIAHCRHVAATKRASFAEWDYWGRPVPNFGVARARLLIVGLAPAAHGANRTGRMFTGDRSGDWLYRALHRAGFANRPSSTSADDGLELHDCAITAVCHCAPPANKPLPDEIAACREWLDATFDAADPRVVVALGQIAWRAVIDLAKRRGWHAGRLPKFAHAARVELGDNRTLLGSYRSRQSCRSARIDNPSDFGLCLIAIAPTSLRPRMRFVFVGPGVCLPIRPPRQTLLRFG